MLHAYYLLIYFWRLQHLWNRVVCFTIFLPLHFSFKVSILLLKWLSKIRIEPKYQNIFTWKIEHEILRDFLNYYVSTNRKKNVLAVKGFYHKLFELILSQFNWRCPDPFRDNSFDYSNKMAIFGQFRRTFKTKRNYKCTGKCVSSYTHYS